MATIIEDYVSFEIAKLLKEKGFHEKVNHVYHYYTSAPFYQRHLRDFNGEDYKNLRHEHYSAPTLQMVMKWLREVHNIFIEISTSIDLNGNYHFSYTILDKECKYVRRGCTDFDLKYEEAVEAALKYTLENLI